MCEPRVRFPAIRSKRREARGGPGAAAAPAAMDRGRHALRGLLAAGALLVAGFFAAFALTSAFSDRDARVSAAQETPAETPAPAADPTGSAAASNTPQATELTGEVTGDVTAQTSGNQLQSNQTADPVKDTVRAPCPVDEIRFLFDRERGVLAVFSDDGRSIASVARESHAFEGPLCRGVPARVKPYAYDGLWAPVYESGGVSCSVARGVDVEIHPIVLDATGQQAGSVLVVSVRGRPAVLASGIVVEDLGGRRFSYSSKHCEPL
jgi:hypothetical protein